MMVSSATTLFPLSRIVSVQNPLRVGDEPSRLAAPAANLRPLVDQPDDADEKIYTRAAPTRLSADELKAAIEIAIEAVEVSRAQLATMPDQTIGQEAQLEKLARDSALQQFPGHKMVLSLSVELTNHVTKMIREEENPDKLKGLEDYLSHLKEQIVTRSADMRSAYDIVGDLVMQDEDGTYFVGGYSAFYKGELMR